VQPRSRQRPRHRQEVHNSRRVHEHTVEGASGEVTDGMRSSPSNANMSCVPPYESAPALESRGVGG
jgi:hypothetical protein